ncbi:uncharacterized protein BDR25DRAFT_301844 [Lindgomyces ingoldianus]|uniref:Uncharacterized protein n=1 Tax=Lindgomyces ingoldianus TaxID=673940 RepID=A0ACB6R348_9PLEO|nr:uncharacterized protein BDR25DRAFT_301844 [Lindgomyces ingoldianus]KAF2473669.1 hypothetical protein BDR25DRAFT_301844 [Lindgomyces ingoldianus]
MLSTRKARIHLIPRVIAFAAAFYAFCWISGFPREYDDDELPPDGQHRKLSTSHSPHSVPIDQVVVSIKTTATDAYSKLPPMLVLTKPIYHDTLLLMSDLEMDIGAFHVEDVLNKFNTHIVESSEDFYRYHQQIDFARAGRELRTLQEVDPQKEMEIRDKLDKYKWLRMVGKTWELRPDRSWYVFVDTDTYLFRSNLMSWLGHYDATEPYFLGNPPDKTSFAPFALGGTMFVLSLKAMQELLVEREMVVPDWDSRIANHASGFEVLSSALSSEISLSLNSSFTRGISGLHPGTIPYGPGMWCEPVIALHSVPAELASDIWRLERDREEYNHVREPMTFEVLWKSFIQPEDMLNARDNWDNLSSGPENAKWNILFEGTQHHKQAAERTHRHIHRDEDGKASSGEDSWEACRDSCYNNDHCVQFSYSSLPTPNYNENPSTKCHLSSSMRLGGPIDPQDVVVDGKKQTRTWSSGWRKDKFEKWAQQQRCKGQQN